MNSDSPKRLRHLKRLPAKLVFDTADRAMAPGTRRRESTSRHLLYEVGGFCLDLRLDRPQQSAEAVVVGQLADRADPLKPLSGLSVFLVAGEELLGRTISNRQGEFRVQYETTDSASLCLSLDDDQVIEVAVDPTAGEETSSAPKA